MSETQGEELLVLSCLMFPCWPWICVSNLFNGRRFENHVSWIASCMWIV